MKILSLLLICLLVPMVSSLTTYSGETIEISVDKEYDYYSISGNSTEVILDVSQVGNIIYVTPDKYSLDDTFELVFFDKETETVTVYQSSGGGGGSSVVYRDKNVTKYIDKPIEKIVTNEVDNEVVKEVSVVPLGYYIITGITGILLLIVVGFIILEIARSRTIEESERGLDANE